MMSKISSKTVISQATDAVADGVPKTVPGTVPGTVSDPVSETGQPEEEQVLGNVNVSQE